MSLPLAVVVLRGPSNRLDAIRPLMPTLREAKTKPQPNAITVING